uniref:zinc ribbon domain-containing protein n=1 Tax=[Ruminococcus] torques TaxID=33039 RepID=UPI00402AF5E5
MATWSINTSCFTRKIKCGRCGKSYQRSNRKGRKDPNANYTIWICGTRRKTGNAHCRNKDIPTISRVGTIGSLFPYIRTKV